MILHHLRDIFGINALEDRVEKIEKNLKNHIHQSLQHFGDYKKRTAKELKLMAEQIDDLMLAAKDLIDCAESTEEARKAVLLI